MDLIGRLSNPGFLSELAALKDAARANSTICMAAHDE